MSQPVWITRPGSLGTIPEGLFYRVPVQAVAGTDDVFFTLLAGNLPAGVQITSTGVIEGTPKNIINVQGVPTQVSEDVTSKFAIRAYTKKLVDGQYVVDRLADQTFTLTVSGNDIPEFITPAGNIGTYYDGSEASIQLEFTDVDPFDRTRLRVISGELPLGLVLNPTTGLISGVIQPLVGPPGTAQPGYDDTQYSQYPFDFSTRSTSKNYQFTVEVSDGKSSDVRTFEIYVYARNAMSADNTSITSDNTFITADVVPSRTPVLLNPSSNLGIARSDNFYAYKFDAVDWDGDQIMYGYTGTLPAGLTLHATTGWLSGYIPNLGATEILYNFSVFAYKVNDPTNASSPVAFSITISGNVGTEVYWVTPSNLGTLINGATSTLSVEAVDTSGRSLQYRLDSGSYSELPQGLTLMPSGNIVGRVSFNTFALDNGTTTFDVDLNQRLGIGITTFDLSFTFTVNAFSSDGYVNVFKTFTILINREFNEPYESLYIKCMPPLSDRAIINDLILNQDIIPYNLVYRADDPNFGVAKNVTYVHAYGLAPASLDLYVQSLDLNHYLKNLTLGEIKTAQALDNNGNILYEVVYSLIIDNLVNNAGTSVGKSVELAYPVLNGDSTEIDIVYPNSLINMRTQVINTVGQINPALPLWMTSKQKNGRVLGFVPAWVIAYTKPGESGKIAYNISQQYNTKLNIIDFDVDRYEINRSQTHNWLTFEDSTSQGEWIPQPPAATTFDIDAHYELPTPNDSSFVFDGGTGYAVGDEILILGSQIGGEDGVNNVTITVNTVDQYGTILSAFCKGFAPILSPGSTFINISGTNIIGTGINATWDLIVVGENPTVFDANSTRFITPSDRWTDTDEFDKYLVFPKRTILG